MHPEFALSHLLNLGKKAELNTIKISRKESAVSNCNETTL